MLMALAYHQAMSSAASRTNELTSAEVMKLNQDLLSGNTNNIDLSTVVPRLAACVESSERAKALLSVLVLGQLGPAAERAVPALVRRLANSQTPGEECAIMNTLRKIGRGAKGTLPTLQEKSKSSDPTVRALAQHAMQRIQQAQR
jgi:hypothetical protein